MTIVKDNRNEMSEASRRLVARGRFSLGLFQRHGVLLIPMKTGPELPRAVITFSRPGCFPRMRHCKKYSDLNFSVALRSWHHNPAWGTLFTQRHVFRARLLFNNRANGLVSHRFVPDTSFLRISKRAGTGVGIRVVELSPGGNGLNTGFTTSRFNREFLSILTGRSTTFPLCSDLWKTWHRYSTLP